MREAVEKLTDAIIALDHTQTANPGLFAENRHA